MSKEVWSNVGHREYKPGIDHGTLYVRTEADMCGGIGEPEPKGVYRIEIEQRIGEVSDAVWEFIYSNVLEHHERFGRPEGIRGDAPDVKPVCFLRALNSECEDTTGCRNPVCARLGREKAGIGDALDVGRTTTDFSGNRVWRTRDRDGVEWDIDRNLPVYTRDLVELADRWTHDGEHTLRSLILRFALELGKPGGEPEVEPVALDEHPAIHWERIAGFEVDNKLWAKGSVKAFLEPAGESEVAPDEGESRPPTPSSRVATEYPDGNFPQLWSRNYIKRLIREEINRAVRELGVSRSSRELKIEGD